MKARWPIHLGVGILVVIIISIITLLPRHQPVIIEQAEAENKPALQLAVNEIYPFTRSELTAGINDLREKEGLRPLAENKQLNQSSQLKANDMKEKRYWAHEAPDGSMPWHFFDEAGYTYTKAGENLAKCYKSTAQVIEAWNNSPLHRENIIGDYTELGFGMTQTTPDCIVIVNHFGKK